MYFSSRFLVAIDRRNGAEVAMETVKLAEEFMLSSDGLVVGLDLSGDPTVSLLTGLDSLELIDSNVMNSHSNWELTRWFSSSGWPWQRPASCATESQELRTEAVTPPLRGRNSFESFFSVVTLHWKVLTRQQKLLQVPSQLEETDLLLNLPPDRIGHGTFLHPEVGGSQSLVDKVVKNKIPLGKNQDHRTFLFCALRLKRGFSWRAVPDVKRQRANRALLRQASLQVLVPVGTSVCDLCKSLLFLPGKCESFVLSMFNTWLNKKKYNN